MPTPAEVQLTQVEIAEAYTTTLLSIDNEPDAQVKATSQENLILNWSLVLAAFRGSDQEIILPASELFDEKMVATFGTLLIKLLVKPESKKLDPEAIINKNPRHISNLAGLLTPLALYIKTEFAKPKEDRDTFRIYIYQEILISFGYIIPSP